MDKSLFVFMFLVFILIFSLAARAQVFEADILWAGKTLSVEVFTGTEGIGVRVFHEEQSTLRFVSDTKAQTLTVIDDLNRTFSVLENQKAIAVFFLFALSRIFGVEEEWLKEGPISFYPSGETKLLPPFGDCFRLKVNDDLSPIFWSREITPSLGSITGQKVGFLKNEGIRFPFWEEIVTLPGFPVAVFLDGFATYRLYAVREAEEDWITLFTFDDENYRKEEWTDFLTPWI
ncbi:MAG TPA: hypothetical protein VLH40_08845 [Atribacteraceae bacterium]|nr:hypothetical protein [Atribacteraceae bacterium]